MSRKKYSKEFKLKLLREHTDQGVSFWKLSKTYGIEASIIRRWWHSYDAHGEAGLDQHNSNLFNYSAAFKEMVVKEYLAGGKSQQSLAKKHGILSPGTICSWTKAYNNHEELTDSRPKGEYLMVKNNKGRKTTLEERIAIVEHCTANAKNYSLTAKEYRYRYREHSGCTHACRKCVYHLRSGESLPMAEGFCRSEKNEYRSFRVSKAALMERNQ